jgi:hypothetical protein
MCLLEIAPVLSARWVVQKLCRFHNDSLCHSIESRFGQLHRWIIASPSEEAQYLVAGTQNSVDDLHKQA